MKGTLEEIFEKRAECSPTKRGLNDIIIIEKYQAKKSLSNAR